MDVVNKHRTLIIHRSVETMDGVVVTVSYSPKGVSASEVNSHHLIRSKVNDIALERKIVGCDDRYAQMSMFADRIVDDMIGDDSIVVHSVKVWRGNDAVEILP